VSTDPREKTTRIDSADKEPASKDLGFPTLTKVTAAYARCTNLFSRIHHQCQKQEGGFPGALKKMGFSEAECNQILGEASAVIVETMEAEQQMTDWAKKHLNVT
jgi:hypothetical protein